ncbi:MAG TPA: SusC/RagA family TonB-linked outer membrane protein [Puia sp.]|jgi:TonB-linked SusC/RagA family outer membrane protein|nr:SusC/RagA family TonB-linked outer membrane protein [Puia sp.]
MQPLSASGGLTTAALLIISVLLGSTTPVSAKNYFQTPQRATDTIGGRGAGSVVTSPIKGVVKNEKGEPLSNVTVSVRGSARQTLTNEKGEFAVLAGETDVIELTSVGYDATDVKVGSEKNLQIVMKQADASLTTVVVTALGIRRSEKSLTYATQQISGDQLTSVKTDNLMNSLNGKVAGLTISPSASGVGGSAKVILRGSRSASGNNQPLYVIDGIPISNSSNANSQPSNTYGGTPDGGDGISNLNPEDIATITVLEGASAAALYGSQAQNGVILITTKRGKAGQMQINFTSSAFASQIAYKPKFQNSYGLTAPGKIDSWGPALTGGGHDNLKDFFQTGTNLTNAISLSGGTQNAQTYFSYANTTARGVEPRNKLERNNFTLRETAKFLHDKLTVDANVNYVTQTINNSPALGIYSNPLTGLYLFARGMDIQPYKSNYLLPDSTGYARQNWPFKGDALRQQNPWWVINRDPNVATRNRILFNASVKYEITPWLNVQVRGNVDHIADNYESDLYAGTDGVSNANGRGNMLINNQTTEQKYGDAILNFNIPSHSSFKLNGLIGTSITDTKTTGLHLQGDLSTPDFFTAGNIIASQPGLTSVTTSPATSYVPGPNGSTVFNSPFPVHSQIQSVFANADLSYKDWIYLTLTGRNDWSSNLAFTPNESFFYPSAGLSVILSQLLQMPSWISYGKVRGTYAQVGNTVPPYLTNVQNLQNAAGQLVFNTAAAFRTLKPEKTKSWELGTEWRFFNSRLNVGFTWYKTNTLDQYFPIQPVTASLFSTAYVNAGNVQNTGIEFTVGYDVLREKDFTWNTSVNGAVNRNKILDVDSKDGINSFVLTSNYNNNYESHLTKGGQYGDIYGYALSRDAQGRILFSGDGVTQPYAPVKNTVFTKIGNSNPKFQLGWRNDFTYKKFSLGLLVDGKFGGQVLSLTQAVMDQYGVSQVTGDARKAGGVKVNGVDANNKPVTTVDANTWYTNIGGTTGASEQYIYSATVVRLREASLGYVLPVPQGFFKNIKVSLVGRNLLYFSKKAPFDPELTMSSGNGLSGVDVFNQPATRNYGLTLNAIF